MDFRKILITGGAGFIGSHLALGLKRDFPRVAVTALDNLKRRGSELNLARLRAGGVAFVHGDVRSSADLDGLPAFDLMIECAAEPSVQAAVANGPAYVLDTNLVGAINAFEAARARQAAVLFLSTSRVYPLGVVNDLQFYESETRFCWQPDQQVPGWSSAGISEEFPSKGVRSLYGASKLAAELILAEYHHQFGLPAIINRGGIVCGPWQMAKADQGVVALWVARHAYGGNLQYLGFGGQGKQVRDMLHVEDLYHLIVAQLENMSAWDAGVYNIGGGSERSFSLCELTRWCEELTGHRALNGSRQETSPWDVRIYVTDASRAQRVFDWSPRWTVQEALDSIHKWLHDQPGLLRDLLG